MTPYAKEVLRNELMKLLDEVAKAPRHSRGYQGPVTPEDVILLAMFRGADGALYVANPAELADGHPDLFLREYETVGARKGSSLLDIVADIAPLVAPATTGWIGTLRQLFRR